MHEAALLDLSGSRAVERSRDRSANWRSRLRVVAISDDYKKNNLCVQNYASNNSLCKLTFSDADAAHVSSRARIRFSQAFNAA